jgi:predicted Zn-dependent protease
MQKLASLGYVGLQKPASGAASAATGTDPKDEIATANKIQNAMSSLEDGRPEGAISVLQPILSAQPNLYLARYAMGVALAQQQQHSQAVQQLHKAIELQPDSVWAHYYMGASLLQTGDTKGAVVHLEIASARLPEFASAHSLLAQAYERAGRADDAKREKARAAQLGAGQP